MLELLSPAGSMEAMKAAVQNGADAVYLGLGNFNARKNAKNFTAEELSEGVRYCHIRGVRVYVTLNTLVSDREMAEAADIIRCANRAGADALLVQDLGVLRLARQLAPELPIHASTQMSVHNLDGALEAARMGISRVVIARELTKQQIAFICRSSPIEVEVFVHGALCMCYSGQCYMSAMIGGRSGNRGMCAQPCRMEYGFGKNEDSYPLSLKDNCLVNHLKELEDIGVSCIKIEGRMKRPEYVAIATRIYSTAIKSKRPPGKEDMKKLSDAFSRQGFTDGYYENKLGPGMFGRRAEGSEAELKKLYAAARATYEGKELQRVPVEYFTAINSNQKAMLAVQDDIGNVCKAEGDIPQTAITKALSHDEIEAQLKKSGGTPYLCTDVKTVLDKGLSMPLSAVNSMRREALSKLTAERARVGVRREGEFSQAAEWKNSPLTPEMTISVLKTDQITDEMIGFSPKVIYIPLYEFISAHDTVNKVLKNERIKVAVVIPRVIGDDEMFGIKKQLAKAYRMGARQALVGNIGHIEAVKSCGFEVRGDFGLNIYNSGTIEQLNKMGFISAAFSFELTLRKIKDIAKPIDMELIAYGRLPLMIMENCIVKNRTGRCTCDNNVDLTDKTGVRFPVLREPGTCRNILLNSQKLYLADKYEEYSKLGIWAIRLMFTTENPGEVNKIILNYCDQSRFEPTGYTRGLYYRGVDK